MKLLHFRCDLGLTELLGEWKQMITPKFFGADLLAGLTVGFVAIPMSLAIALASGVPPGAGLITAIIAGIVCALFGGTRLAVSGPAAAMSVLIADTVEKFGMNGLIVIGLMVGLMQLTSGVLGLGRLTRFVPIPVVAGFTAGIGVIILIGQLPRAFGLIPPEESHTLDVIKHISQYFHQINYICLAVVIGTLILIRGLPKVLPKIPPILFAVVVTTLAVYFLKLNTVPLIGEIPNHLPKPQLPMLGGMPLISMLMSAVTIFLLASLETLLSASAIDKLTQEKKHDSNQELIGQGLGNVAVALFGGLPVTNVIARSLTNVQAGAKTRRASVMHALLILLSIYTIAPLISYIPIAVLAAVLFSIALTMINTREFFKLWQTDRSEGVVFTITFLLMITVGLSAGIQAGILAAILIGLFKSAKTALHISVNTQDKTVRLSMTGGLTFVSVPQINALEKKVEDLKAQSIVMDLSSINTADTSGAIAIVDLFNSCRERNIQFYLKGLPRRFEDLFKMSGGQKLIEDHYLLSESELYQKAGLTPGHSAHGRLLHGIQRFYSEHHQNDKRLYDFISEKQDPHTLFITCSDSRIVPSLITSADPGELFIIRNVGNYVPPYDERSTYSEAAALEFSLKSLNITDIVICGHANCGAMRACKDPESVIESPQLNEWIKLMSSQLSFSTQTTVNEIARINVIQQLDNIKTYPIVKAKLREGLHLHAWFFDFDHSLVYELDRETRSFEPIEKEMVMFS